MSLKSKIDRKLIYFKKKRLGKKNANNTRYPRKTI